MRTRNTDDKKHNIILNALLTSLMKGMKYVDIFKCMKYDCNQLRLIVAWKDIRFDI